MQMTVTDLDSGIRRIALTGRLDVTGVDAVETRFTASTVPFDGPVEVDMSGVEFVASLGIRMFVSVGRALARKGRKLVLVDCQPQVAEVLEMSALDDILTMQTSGG